MTSSQEQAWQKYGPKYLIDVQRANHDTSIAATDAQTSSDLFGREAYFVVEIGTGMGEAILHAAAENPNQNFLGVEVYQAGLAKTILGAEKLGLENLRLIEANAPEVFSTLLAPDCVDEVRVFFADPWHKAKHNKRRLISPVFVEQLSKSLVTDGRVRLATDWQDYANQMVEVFDSSIHFKRDFEGDWAERFEGRTLTSFENKGQRAGRIIRDLSFTKTT